jgi:hypothetical protein
MRRASLFSCFIVKVYDKHVSVCRAFSLGYEADVPELQFQPLGDSLGTLSTSCSVLDETYLPQEQVSYHLARSMICFFLSTIAPPLAREERTPISCVRDLRIKQNELETLIAELLARNMQDERNKSLIDDLSGQVRLALKDQYFTRWGQHFLQCIHNAHAKQLCNSFKDPGPLQYGKDSPLFKKCKDKLDRLFDILPPPKPSVTLKNEKGSKHRP